MTPYKKRLNPYIQRMVEDMQLRNLADSTIDAYTYLHVRRQHFDRAPSPVDWLPVRQCPKWAEPQQPEPTPKPPTREAAEARSEPATNEDSTNEPLPNSAPNEPEPPIRRTSGRKPRKKRRRRS